MRSCKTRRKKTVDTLYLNERSFAIYKKKEFSRCNYHVDEDNITGQEQPQCKNPEKKEKNRFK
jgi:hypothetical protein